MGLIHTAVVSVLALQQSYNRGIIIFVAAVRTLLRDGRRDIVQQQLHVRINHIKKMRVLRESGAWSAGIRERVSFEMCEIVAYGGDIRAKENNTIRNMRCNWAGSQL